MGGLRKKIPFTYWMMVDRHAGADRLPASRPAISPRTPSSRRPIAGTNPFAPLRLRLTVVAAVDVILLLAPLFHDLRGQAARGRACRSLRSIPMAAAHLQDLPRITVTTPHDHGHGHGHDLKRRMKARWSMLIPLYRAGGRLARWRAWPFKGYFAGDGMSTASSARALDRISAPNTPLSCTRCIMCRPGWSGRRFVMMMRRLRGGAAQFYIRATRRCRSATRRSRATRCCTASCSTSGTSTNCTTSSSCAPPNGSARYTLWKLGDGWLIDGFGPDGVSARVRSTSPAIGVVRLQTGYLYHYAFAMLIGVAGLT
jgi:hypothetical protein